MTISAPPARGESHRARLALHCCSAPLSSMSASSAELEETCSSLWRKKASRSFSSSLTSLVTCDVGDDDKTSAEEWIDKVYGKYDMETRQSILKQGLF